MAEMLVLRHKPTCDLPLKSCPFCGSPAEFGETLRGGKPHAHFVTCTVCPMATPWREVKAEAEAIWNKRVDLP